MKIENKRFFLVTILCIMFFLSIPVSINYFLNPYGVFFKYKNFNVSTPINERYIKTSYILNNPKKYDSFIFGSSRVGVLEGEKLSKIGKFYNMTFAGALPIEILDILKTFEEKNIKIKNIILGIDDFDFLTEPKLNEKILYKISYEKLQKNKGLFFKYYLLKNPFNEVNKLYVSNKEKTYYDILNTGKWEKSYADVKIENDIESHKKNLSKIEIYPSNTIRIKETILEIESIIKLCERNNIKLMVVYLPRYVNSYIANRKVIEESKIELQKKTGYWDFVQLDKYTNNEYYWYEESHYRPVLGRMILKRIFNENFEENIKVPNNFGKYKQKL